MEREYYVYAWYCKDWGNAYFYVGKGKGNRYKIKSSRGKAFTAIITHWNCDSLILESNLTEEEAYIREGEIKEEMLFEKGQPIIDGEGRNGIKNMAVQIAKREKRRTDPNYREGRKRLVVNNFNEYLEKQQKGEMTAHECCEELGISRSTFYNLARVN